MARIKIEDLPVLEDLSPKETKGIFGGEETGRPKGFGFVEYSDSEAGFRSDGDLVQATGDTADS